MLTQTIECQGCALSYKVAGSGEPVVFIQGVGIHGDGWLPQTEVLSSQFRCLTFDHRGMGLSQPIGAKITMDQLAADTLAVMDAAGFSAAHLVGHSLGGAVAIQVALMARSRVKSLGLLCTSARGSDATRLSFAMLMLGLRTRVGTRRMRAQAFLEIVMPPDYLATQNRDALAARLKPLLGHDLADTPPVAMRQLRALQRFDATARLPELAGVPVLVLSAAGDIIFPPHCGMRLAAGIPAARFVEIPAAAHGVPIQCADAVNRELVRHFQSAARSQTK